MGGTPVKASAVVTQQDGPGGAFADGEIESAGSAGHQRDGGGELGRAGDQLRTVSLYARMTFYHLKMKKEPCGSLFNRRFQIC